MRKEKPMDPARELATLILQHAYENPDPPGEYILVSQDKWKHWLELAKDIRHDTPPLQKAE